MRERGGKDKGKRQENKGTEVSKSNMHKTQLHAIFVDIPLKKNRRVNQKLHLSDKPCIYLTFVEQEERITSNTLTTFKSI